jgi:putative ABC transport system substrate-binding protein
MLAFQMRRRDLLAGVMLASWPWVVRAQAPPKKPLVAYLSGGGRESRAPLLMAFAKGMRDRGLIEGQSYALEARYANGQFDRIPELARELLALQPDVFLVSTTPANVAAKRIITDLPIVMVAVADPVGSGLIASLSKPGGNITGVTNITAELAGKRLEILKELVPAAKRIAVLVNRDDPNARLQLQSASDAAAKLALELQPVIDLRSSAELEGAFETASRAGAHGALRMVDPLNAVLRAQTVAIAAKHGLPTIYAFREDVEAGGLVSYGTSQPDQYRQAATFVSKILAGEKPSEIPVEQPVKLELVVNSKAAKALGLNVPPTLLARADEVID